MFGIKGLGEHFLGNVFAAFSAGESCLKDGVGVREVISIEGCKSSALVPTVSGGYVKQVQRNCTPVYFWESQF